MWWFLMICRLRVVYCKPTILVLGREWCLFLWFWQGFIRHSEYVGWLRLNLMACLMQQFLSAPLSKLGAISSSSNIYKVEAPLLWHACLSLDSCYLDYLMGRFCLSWDMHLCRLSILGSRSISIFRYWVFCVIHILVFSATRASISYSFLAIPSTFFSCCSCSVSARVTFLAFWYFLHWSVIGKTSVSIKSDFVEHNNSWYLTMNLKWIC